MSALCWVSLTGQGLTASGLPAGGVSTHWLGIRPGSTATSAAWLTARLILFAFGGVTMSIHKLSAGSGYDYLTRQVATLDATEKGHVGLASYYTERGETPGAWIGSGLAGIDGLTAGDTVTRSR